MARQYSDRRATQNLHDYQIVTQLSASHGSRFPLAFVVRTGSQRLAQRLRASPNRPVWSGAAVQAPKEGRSRETTTRCIQGLENVNRSIYGSSQPRHTLVLERIPATSAPTVQTAKRCHVWLFGRLEPLVETLSGGPIEDAVDGCCNLRHRTSFLVNGGRDCVVNVADARGAKELVIT